MPKNTKQVSYLRQHDIFNPQEFDEGITIIGCGGIGSSLATTLAKMGLKNLTLIDYDRVESHNIPNQSYLPSDIGKYKVKALANHITDLGAEPRTFIGPFEEHEKEINGLVCSGLDSMPPRHNLWNILKRKKSSAYFDGRLGGQKIVIYGVDLSNTESKKAYELTLHPEEESEPLPCTQRSIIDVAFLVSAVMARAIRKQLKENEIEFVQLVDWENFSINRITSASDYIVSMEEKE